jgi:hypothetical protein
MDPIKRPFELFRPKFSEKKSLRFANKVIKDTARITPGIAYPEIEKFVR